MGLGTVRSAATGNFIEAVSDVTLAAVGYHVAGLPGLLVGGSLGLVAMVPSLRLIARRCGESFWGTYMKPLAGLGSGLVIAIIPQALAGRTSLPVLWGVAMAVAGAAAVLQLRRIHRGVPPR
jgi:hypothetical protein